MKEMKNSLRLILLIAVIMTVTFISASCLFAWYFTAPKHSRIDIGPDALPVGYEDVAFRTSDSLTIRGWYVPPRDSGGPVVILLHGYTGNRTHMLGKMWLLHEAGIGSLLYDARGCGESDGELVSMGYYEVADLEGAMRYLQERGVRDIGCIGVSQGGATIALAAPRLRGLKCAILESTYDDMENAIDRRFRNYLGLPGWLGASLMVPIAEWRLGCTTRGIAPVDRIGDLPCPILVMSGASDTRVWPEDTERLFDAAREPKQLWLVPGADHEDLQAAAPVEYRERVLEFIGEYLRSP
jgi:uncharacterized protein